MIFLKLKRIAVNWLLMPVSFATLVLLTVTAVCQVLCAKTGGLIDVMEPATISNMQRWCLVTLKFTIPFVVLPGFAFMGIAFLYEETKSVLRSKTKGLVASVAVLVFVIAVMSYVKSILLPDGVAQTYSLWQRLFVAIGEFDFKGFVNNILSSEHTPWFGIAIAATSAIISFVSTKRDTTGKILHWGLFCLGAVLSIATGALAIEFFSVLDTKHPHFADPVPMPVFWGETVPLIVIACVFVFCIAFAISWIGWRVMCNRTLIGKFFSFVSSAIAVACVIAWSVVPFLVGLFMIPLFLLVIVLVVAAIFGGVFTKTMFRAFERDMLYTPPPSSSSDDTTSYRSTSGEVFDGSGEHPYTITSRSDGSSYDLGHDGRYHERGGNRTLETS